MSSKTIKVILRVAGVISGIGGMVIGGEIAENVLQMESFVAFLVAISGGFLSLVICFAIGNAVADLERTAKAAEEIVSLLKTEKTITSSESNIENTSNGAVSGV